MTNPYLPIGIPSGWEIDAAEAAIRGPENMVADLLSLYDKSCAEKTFCVSDSGFNFYWYDFTEC